MQHDSKQIAAALLAFCLTSGAMPAIEHSTVLPSAYASEVMDGGEIVQNEDMIYIEYDDHIALVYCEPDGDTLFIPDKIGGKPVTELTDGAFCNEYAPFAYSVEIPDLPDSVKKIVIPDGVERIGKKAFMNDKDRYGLEAVILPETLKEIGNDAFNNNRRLKLYGLSENTVIGELAFYETSYDIYTRENIPYRINKDGMLYIDYEDHIALVYCEPEGDTLTIPDTIDGKPVTEIADDAFSKLITFSCFDENGSSTIDIPPIPKGVKKVIIPEGIERIGEDAFRGEITKPVLEEAFLPSTLKEIAMGAFNYNVDLNVYGLPENVEIGDDAFYRTRFDVNERANYIEKEDLIYKEYADHMVLYYCAPDGDTLNIPDMIDGKPVTEIAAKAFCGRYYCDVKIPALPENVTNVVIPQSVKVCEGAFAGTQLEGQYSSVPVGDVNLDGKITLADSLAILQFIANEDKYPLSEQAQKNADCFNPGDGITGNDAVAVMRYDTKTVSKLPIIEK